MAMADILTAQYWRCCPKVWLQKRREKKARAKISQGCEEILLARWSLVAGATLWGPTRTLPYPMPTQTLPANFSRACTVLHLRQHSLRHNSRHRRLNSKANSPASDQLPCDLVHIFIHNPSTNKTPSRIVEAGGMPAHHAPRPT